MDIPRTLCLRITYALFRTMIFPTVSNRQFAFPRVLISASCSPRALMFFPLWLSTYPPGLQDLTLFAPTYRMGWGALPYRNSSCLCGDVGSCLSVGTGCGRVCACVVLLHMCVECAGARTQRSSTPPSLAGEVVDLIGGAPALS